MRSSHSCALSAVAAPARDRNGTHPKYLNLRTSANEDMLLAVRIMSESIGASSCGMSSRSNGLMSALLSSILITASGGGGGSAVGGALFFALPAAFCFGVPPPTDTFFAAGLLRFFTGGSLDDGPLLPPAASSSSCNSANCSQLSIYCHYHFTVIIVNHHRC